MSVLFCGDYTHERSIFAAFVEFYYAINQSKEGMILAHTYILTRVVDCTALTDDDVTGDALLTAKNLNAKSFAFAFTTIAGTTNTFFVCHIDLVVFNG